MDNTKKITCIICPRGCIIDVKVENGEVKSIKGNQCRRGADYASTEVLHPKRVITTTVYVPAFDCMLPVRSDKPVPKEKIKDIIPVIKGLSIRRPVRMGDVLIRDIEGVNIIASSDMGMEQFQHTN
ncbi:MAG TPA: DUF1667 domain-containing protein [Clostridiales bacterium]|nr:DUF1667 domain-containing protein [Clostridiales bacterium]